MHVNELTNEGLKRRYQITVDANAVQDAIDSRLKEVGKKLQLPGFRPGAAPLAIVKRKKGQAVTGEVIEQLVNKSSVQLFKDKEFRPANQPHIHLEQYEEGKDLVFTTDFEIFPEIPNTDWSSISFTKWTIEPSDEEIAKNIERLRENNAQYQPIEKPRATQKGDVVFINFVGKIDDVAFDGGSAENFRLELGSNSLIPGFEDQLIGKKAGDAVDVKVTFPANYGQKDLAGKPAIFETTINEIQEKQAPLDDDALAKELGFEDFDALKKLIVSQLKKSMDELAFARTKKDLFDVLDKKVKFDIPTSMLEQEFKGIWEQFQHTEEGKKERSEKEEKAKQEEFRVIAERRVRLGMLLAETAREQKLEISEAEIRQALFSQAQMFPGQERYIIEFYQKNPAALDSLRGPILENKAVHFIIEKASTKEKATTVEEVNKFFEENQPE